MNKILEWYSGLQVREQRMVLVGSVAVSLLVLFGGLLLPLESAVSTAVTAEQTRRDDLCVDEREPAGNSRGGAMVAPDTGEAPMVLVDRIGREAGLGSTMRGTQPSGAGVRVQLEAARFDTLVAWLATLEERHGLEVESISVDRTERPGLVNVNVTLTPSRR